MGELKLRGKVWWIRWRRNGKRFEESSGSQKKGDAIRLLKVREGAIEQGLPVTPKTGRVTFEEAAVDLLNDYKVNGRKSYGETERRLRLHLAPYFGSRRMANITTTDVRAFITKRLADAIVVRKARRIQQGDEWIDVPAQTKPVSNAEINRELAALKRMFRLAVQAGKLHQPPHIPMLRERNVRSGFFEREQFEAMLAHLPDELRPVLHFGYTTGWRIESEVLPIEWRQVDFAGGEVRLDAGATKNGEPRVFPMTRALRELLEGQRTRVQRLAQERGRIIRYVFVRDTGMPIKSFGKAFATACRKAGCPGRIPHDLRRTAVRNLVRAGIPERVAMTMTGHLTRSVFERYNIVSGGDLQDAVRRLDADSDGDKIGTITPSAGTARSSAPSLTSRIS